MAADPLAFPPGGRHFVAGAFGDDLALELGERQEDVQRQAAQRGRRVELLRDRDEAHAVSVEHFDDPGEVHQGPAEPVDLIDNDAIHGPRFDGGQKAEECGPVHVAAGIAAIVEMIGDHLPSFVLLGDDEGLAGFPLGVEGVELLLESLLRGLAGVDRAADCPSLPVRPRRTTPRDAVTVSHLHHRCSRLQPKNRKPFHLVPVTSLAIALRDR
jgi:hypothetical protein